MHNAEDLYAQRDLRCKDAERIKGIVVPDPHPTLTRGAPCAKPRAAFARRSRPTAAAAYHSDLDSGCAAAKYSRGFEKARVGTAGRDQR
jgi:hypothetical protein